MGKALPLFDTAGALANLPGYDCIQCPGKCCTYPEIDVTDADVARLAKFLGISVERATDKYTKKLPDDRRGLRMKSDQYFDQSCVFLDDKTRRCAVYKVRPSVCRRYPEEKSCGYFIYLLWERRHQDDNKYIP